jgi:ligand-binding sensor domain-containing protein
MDRKKNLWIDTDANRVGIFNTSKFTYHEVPIRWKDSLRMFRGKHFFEDNRGRLFLVVLKHGFYVYREKENEFVSADDSISIPEKWNPIGAVTEPKSGRIWMACDSGLAVFNPATGHLSYRGHNTDRDPVIAQFGKEVQTGGVLIDKNGEWLSFVSWPYNAGNPFVYRYVYKTGSVQKFDLGADLRIGYHEIEGSLQQQNGQVWYYGKAFIAEYRDEKKNFVAIRNEYKNEQSIKFDEATYIYEDRENNLWITTDNGVFLFNPGAQFFDSYNLLRPDGTGVVDGAAQTILQLDN